MDYDGYEGNLWDVAFGLAYLVSYTLDLERLARKKCKCFDIELQLQTYFLFQLT